MIKFVNDSISEGRLTANIQVISNIMNLMENIVSNVKDWEQNVKATPFQFGTELENSLSGILSREDFDEISVAGVYLYSFLYERCVYVNTSQVCAEMSQLFDTMTENKSDYYISSHFSIDMMDKKLPHILHEFYSNLSTNHIVEERKTIEGTIEQWKLEMEQREKRINDLKTMLEQQETGFNFVGLHKGFKTLCREKTDEKNRLKYSLILTAVFILLGLSIEAYLILDNAHLLYNNLNLYLYVLLPTVSISALSVYFFRIILFNYKDAKAQLLQIKLRMTLCQFIQSYADYSQEMAGKNGSALARFESIIFSSIVSDSSSIPSVYDGVEQLSNLIGKVKG